ncbi:MAG: hypothetical protein M1497_12320 [Nitrospirae bacterium]|nr:hypothetical protein [Nitrospirota bacterium]
MGLAYDELYISTMREIGVCRQTIRKLTKMLGRMERKYGMSTPEFLERFNAEDMRDHKDYAKWHEGCEGLKNCEKRLKEHYEILRTH